MTFISPDPSSDFTDPPKPPPTSAPTPPEAPPASGGGGGAGTNYGGILGGNSAYLAAHALALQQLAFLKARFGANAARALVNLGDASLYKQIKGLTLPGGTSALVDQANKSGTSVLSQILHAHNLNTGRIPAQLAGRGFYRSGETGYSLGEENRQYGQRGTQARQQTLDYLNQLYDNYANAQFGLQQSDLNAYFNSYQNALNSGYGYGGGGGGGGSPPTPAYSPATAPYGLTAAGTPVDLSSQGPNWYNPDAPKPWWA